MMIVSFIICLLFFLFVGMVSVRKRQNTKEDYYLASRTVTPWLVGLSAVATNNSGYMFIGVIGYTYAVGLSSCVLMFGWILGDFLASLWVHKKLRAAAVQYNQSSYIATLSEWAGFSGRSFRIVAALVALLFLLAYASAQLVAGSKALQVLLGWPSWSGAILGAVLVVAYCIAGGIRASIWTDAAQSLVMILAMAVLLITAIWNFGGLDIAYQSMKNIPGFLDLEPPSLFLPGMFGVLIFFCGWLVAGFSVIAQPHIMVRFMALNSAKGLVRVRLWYYLWFLVFYMMATAVGMLARIYLPDTQGFDAELALPTMAVQLLPPILVGLILAGIFAATISTADSLLLSCSAFLSQDLAPGLFSSANGAKMATLIAAFASLVWALLNKQSVFSLVVLSWAMLAVCFVPLIITLLAGYQSPQLGSIVIMLVGCVGVMLLHWLGMGGDLYLGMPVIAVSLVIYVLLIAFNGASKAERQ